MNIMDLQYKIICHPNELLSRNNKDITEWLNEVVSNKNIIIELPIKDNIIYPIFLSVNKKLNGISRFEILKAAFYFYMENEIDSEFLTNIGFIVDKNKKCLFDYISEYIKEIKTIKKIDDDEFILIHKSEIEIEKINAVNNSKRDNAILCLKCYNLQLVCDKNYHELLGGKYNCKYCQSMIANACKIYNM